jgi:hypothetical protein
MVTVTDKIYSYTHLIGWNEKQKTETIKVQPDKQITIDLISLYLEAPPKGLATAWLLANGKQLGRWTTDKAEMQYFSAKPAFIAPSGSDVVLEWGLKSSSATNKARMKMLSYDSSIIPAIVTEPEPGNPEPEPPEEPEQPEIKNCVMIICTSAEDAGNLEEDLKPHVGDRKIKKFVEVKNV